MSSTHPYYHRSKPKPQNEKDFLRVISLKQVVKDLRDQKKLPQGETISIKDLNQQFQPLIPNSVQSLLLKMNAIAYPFDDINLTNAHMEPYGVPDPVTKANSLFDKRAAAAVSCAVRTISFNDMLFIPSDDPSGGHFVPFDPFEVLLEVKSYDDAPDVHIPTFKSLAASAYPDYFPSFNDDNFRRIVSEAILAANPGWCGTFGPGVDGAFSLGSSEGNYDISQMHLLQIAYRYYEELSDEAREHLITVLLAQGRIHRPRVDDTFTSGIIPDDWSRAGFVSPLGIKYRIAETENHILMINTVRYLTNQLLYQRYRDPVYDNRRNGGDKRPSCTDLILSLLRNILRDDFSEYNAKPYQHETRSALLNLCSYAYDHEVRLAARMVLDYISAHIAVSSSDLRRMVPFRRRNEGKNDENIEKEHRRVAQLPGGFMDVSLLDWYTGADPMVQAFAMQAGNTRAFETPNTRAFEGVPKVRPWSWSIASDGNDEVMEVLSDYRLPPSIHDLFVNDLHRRFFQRLHRVYQDDVDVTGRNCDNFEIYAGSPSYLITAGGSPATWAIDPGPVELSPKLRRINTQQLGVAVTTSFMPTGLRTGPGTQNYASDLIQFGHFSDTDVTRTVDNIVYNYGVAPDFACGHQVNLPLWCLQAIAHNRAQNPNEDYGKFEFVDRGSAGDGPGFFLAFFRYGNLAIMEAFDTWLHPDITFEVFKRSVHALNVDLMNRGLHNEVADKYRTQNGNLIHFVIWDGSNQEDRVYGANVLSIDYSGRDPMDSQGDAGNVTDKFLRGTVMNSLADGVVEITNHFLGTTLTLDMYDPKRPKRTSETGEVEEAGSNHEVWVDFSWTGPSEGDFFRPFNTISAAAAAVANEGVIKIMPGSTTERPFFAKNKRFKLVAPIGGVEIGVRQVRTLRNANVSFHTNNEDKDSDTHVTLIIKDRDNRFVASLSNDLGHFDDNSDAGPYKLEVVNENDKASLQQGSVTIRIDPNGHDTWRFNFFLDLQFGDGSHLSGGTNGLELTQDRREQTFGLDGMLRS